MYLKQKQEKDLHRLVKISKLGHLYPLHFHRLNHKLVHEEYHWNIRAKFRSYVIQAFQSLVSTGVGTTPPPRLRTSSQKKPVMQKRHESYGRSVRSLLDWLKWTGTGVAFCSQFPSKSGEDVYMRSLEFFSQVLFGICCWLISPIQSFQVGILGNDMNNST